MRLMRLMRLGLGSNRFIIVALVLIHHFRFRFLLHYYNLRLFVVIALLNYRLELYLLMVAKDWLQF